MENRIGGKQIEHSL